MTSETKWRAEQIDAGIEHSWAVFEVEGVYEELIAEELTEAQAKQMVADHGKAALCEELADALEAYAAPESYDDFGGQAPVMRDGGEKARAALKAAGRTPG